MRPEDGYIVDSLGWAHYRLGDYTSAVQYLEKAIELVPEDPTINDHLGDAYWQSGRASRRATNGGAPCSSGRRTTRSNRSRPSSTAAGAHGRSRAAAKRACRSRPLRRRKVNLYLHVTGRRADGYHLIDSLVAFADIGDRLTAEPARLPVSRRSTAPRPRASPRLGDDNLVLRAARLLADQAGIPPAPRSISKSICRSPRASAAGRADAAAALAVLSRLVGSNRLMDRSLANSAPGSAPMFLPASTGAPSGSAASASASSRPSRCRRQAFFSPILG